MPVLFTVTILLGAMLLFLVQPMFARMLLPRLGGSPAVWNSAMLFYQVALLLGYAYAHWMTLRLAVRRQAALHAVLLFVPFLVLPLAIPGGWTPPTEHSPIPWLLMVMLLRVGPPFVALSATSPLLQRWFAGTGHRAARDPYFLFAASNAGSLAGLLAYPLLMEPRLGLGQQSRLWQAGYALLVLSMLACAAVAWRLSRPDAIAKEETGAQVPSTGAVTHRRRAWWVLRAFVPSSLMLSVTTYLSTNLSPFPLLWVIPLAIYLLTFIVAFAVHSRLFLRLLPIAFIAVLIPLGAMLAQTLTLPMWATIALHLAALAGAALACHGALAADRPEPQHLTEFYLWVSIGGALGGAFNALLAPLIFTRVEEYPLGLLLACLAMPALASRAERLYDRLMDLALPLCVAGLSMGLANLASRLTLPAPWMAPAMRVGLPALVCVAFAPRPLRFSLGVAALLVVNAWNMGLLNRPLYVERSFFGISRVVRCEATQRHYLMHGDTLHGTQSLVPERRCEALSYYHATGPIGQIMTTWATGKERIGLVGLGTGSLAVYSRPWQRWTYYEIDPTVARIARDPRFFTFLRECARDVEIVMGDARLSLAQAATGEFELIVLDAYSSDAIPVHLLTREALALYLDKLAPGGLLAFHTSNRYLELEPVLAALAQDAGLLALVQSDLAVTKEESELGKSGSTWVLLAREQADLDPMAGDPRWQPLQPRAGVAPWTDDYSSILSVMRWR